MNFGKSMDSLKHAFVKKTTKLYFGIKGFFISMLLKKGDMCIPMNAPSEKGVHTVYYYRGENNFFVTREGTETHFGVTYFDSRIKKYKNWEIGVMNFKKC